MINIIENIDAGLGLMDSRRVFEKLAMAIASLGRSEVEHRIRNFKGNFKFDFTDEYLAGQTIDRLRHILFAAIATRLQKKTKTEQPFSNSNTAYLK